MKSSKILKTLSTIGNTIISVLLSITFILPASLLSSATIASADSAIYSGSISKKERAESFDRFLENCTQEERIFLMQSMQALPDIPKRAFGKLTANVKTQEGTQEIALKSYEDYEEEFRPKTFNELHPILVLQAVELGLISISWSPKDIKKELYWHAHHWSKYPFGNKDSIDYHEIAEWCAQKKDVVGDSPISREHMLGMSTYELERFVSEKYLTKKFNDLWQDLNLQQKGKLIDELQEKTGRKFTEFQKETLINWENATIEDKGLVCKELNEGNNRTGQVALSASMGAGAVVLGGLGITASVMGFAFYTTAAQAIASVASLSLWANAQVMSTLGVLSGPWGWGIAAVLLVSSPFVVGWADPVVCANFIVAKHSIEIGRLTTNKEK